MRNPFRRETRAASSYTDTLLGLIQTDISGTAADASQVAAAEFGISYLSRAFASAAVDPAVEAMTAPVLAAIGRALMVKGEWAAVIDVEDQIILRPAMHWDIDGGADERSWVYSLDLPAPSGQFETVRSSSAGVVHIRVNESSDAPWQGRSSLKTANLSAKLMAHLETRTGEEASSRSGFLLLIPQVSEDKFNALRSDLKALKGNTVLVEASSSDYGNSTDRRGSGEYQITRFGARFPAENIELRRDVAAHVLGAMGCPSVLLTGSEGTALREGYRQVLTGWIQPLGKIVSAELTRKLNQEISLDFSALAAADIAGRARALGSLVQAGIPINEALVLAGLDG